MYCIKQPGFAWNKKSKQVCHRWRCLRTGAWKGQRLDSLYHEMHPPTSGFNSVLTAMRKASVTDQKQTVITEQDHLLQGLRKSQ